MSDKAVSDNSEKVCVVVGVGPGVGLAVARRFAREGFYLALIARRAEALQEYVAALQKEGAIAYSFPADVSDSASLEAAFAQIEDKLGNADVLVYNAVAGRAPGKVLDLTAAEWVDDYKVNVVGALIAVQQVIPHMRAQKRGTILFTGGGLALKPNPQYASMGVGKAGIRSLAFSLGAELEPEGIHVATVTIRGFVRPGSRFDPDRIADSFWELHSQPSGAQEREKTI